MDSMDLQDAASAAASGSLYQGYSMSLPSISLTDRTLRAILEDYLEVERGSNPHILAVLESQILLRFFRCEKFTAYHLIYDIDDPASKVYFIEKGNVELVTMSPVYLEQSKWLSTRFPAAGFYNLHALRPTAESEKEPSSIELSSDENMVRRVNKVCAGGIFGESDFFLGRSHRYS